MKTNCCTSTFDLRLFDDKKTPGVRMERDQALDALFAESLKLSPQAHREMFAIVFGRMQGLAFVRPSVARPFFEIFSEVLNSLLSEKGLVPASSPETANQPGSLNIEGHNA